MTSSLTPSRWQRILMAIERTGNRLPVPALLFVYLCVLIAVVSWICASLGWRAELPGVDESIQARSLLSGEGVRWMLTSAVTNFVQFAPVGAVLVAMLGIGVAEHSGLLRLALTRLVMSAPQILLTWILVFGGILSSLAVDAGYVVVIPLGGLLFAAAGRPPLAGIAAAFAGVSAGYSANLLLTPIDAILAGISSEAAGLVVPGGYQVSVAGNYYFTLVSTFVLSVIGAWVTHQWVMPWLARTASHLSEPIETVPVITTADRRGLRAVLVWTLLFVGLIALTVIPEGGLLREPGEGVFASAFLTGIVTVIALYAAIAGWLFGRFSGRYQRSAQVIEGMESAMATMATYLVLMFFAAQFVNYFAWSQIGTLLAISGADALRTLELDHGVLLVAFVFLAAFINIFVGSASAKWSLLAPVFVPMLFLLGISPEATQVAFRIGDSTTNIITPLMPYFGLVIAFAQRYQSDLGIGTLIAMMLPYSIAFLLGWTALLGIWVWFDWPLGPGASVLLSALQ